MRRSVLGVALAVLLGAASSVAPARDAFTAPECFEPAHPFDLYGPTDVNGALGHGRLAVGVNREGTISVLKWPNPSFYDQVKYFTVDREEDYEDDAWDPYRRRDVNFGVLENEGAFAGLFLELRDGRSEMHWLRRYSRGWRIEQRFDSPDSDTLVTTWRHRSLGLTVTGVDVAPPVQGEPQRDILVRRYVVRREPRSPVVSARLIAFANLNPIASKGPWVPGYDWCQEGASNHIRVTTFEPASQAALWTVGGSDGGSTSILMGLRDRASGFHVGGDGLDPWAPAGAAAQDAYLDAADGRLSGNLSAAGPATVALAQDLDVSRATATADVILAFAAAPEDARAALRHARATPFLDHVRSSEAFWRTFLAPAPLPDLRGDPSIRSTERAALTEAAKRSLIALRMMTADSGAIVASHTTQPPYGEDWVRDGAFFNHALHVAGHPDMVRRHNLFYAAVQTGSGRVFGPSLPRPPGNWAMNYYADGVEGGPLPWEVDETGLGAWTLWQHFLWMRDVHRDRRAREYLDQVFPAIARAADWLTACEDPRSGLLCPQTEDDAFPPSGVYGTSLTQERQGAITAVMALRAAIEAGGVVADPRVGAWHERLARLVEGIDRPGPEDTGSAPRDGGYWNGSNWGIGPREGGIWFLWPGRYRPYSDPRMLSQARLVSDTVQRSIDDASPIGSQYEGKGTLAVAIFASESDDAALLERVRRQIRWLGTYVPTRDTHLFGEHYYNVCAAPPGADGCRPGTMRSVPSTGIPHLWQHTLYYLSAVYAWGTIPYAFSGRGYYERTSGR